MRAYKLLLIYPDAVGEVYAVTLLTEEAFKDVIEEDARTGVIQVTQVDNTSPDLEVRDTLVFTRDLRGVYFLGFEDL